MQSSGLLCLKADIRRTHRVSRTKARPEAYQAKIRRRNICVSTRSVTWLGTILVRCLAPEQVIAFLFVSRTLRPLGNSRKRRTIAPSLTRTYLVPSGMRAGRPDGLDIVTSSASPGDLSPSTKRALLRSFCDQTAVIPILHRSFRSTAAGHLPRTIGFFKPFRSISCC